MNVCWTTLSSRWKHTRITSTTISPRQEYGSVLLLYADGCKVQLELQATGYWLVSLISDVCRRLPECVRTVDFDTQRAIDVRRLQRAAIMA